MSALTEIAGAVIGGDRARVAAATRQVIEQGIPPKTILDEGLIAGMAVVGDRFRAHEIFLPDVLLAAKAMYAGMDELRPLLVREGVPSIGKVVIGTVRGDLHDIGKNMVATMLRGVGFDIVDLGINISTDDFVANVEKHRPDILGMSALLTTTMPEMKKVIDALASRGLRGKVKVIVGGAPVNEKFARDIGADGYAEDAGSSVDLAKKLLQR